jgi:hypothetical protein
VADSSKSSPVNGTAPVEGPGSRLLYHATKSALRYGQVDEKQWDDIYIGPLSFAGGRNTKATGLAAFAYGFAEPGSSIESIEAVAAIIAHAKNSSTIVNRGASSLVLADVNAASSVVNTAISALISLRVNQSSKVNVSGNGIGLFGSVDDFSMVTMEGPGSGNFVFVTNSGSVHNDGAGSLLSAYVSGGEVITIGFGSQASGYVAGGGIISSRGHGSRVQGVAHNGGSQNSLGIASSSQGYVGAMEKQRTSGIASFASGRNLRVESDYATLVGAHGTLSTSPFHQGALAIAGGYSNCKGDGISVVLGTSHVGDCPIGYGHTSTWLSPLTGYAEYFSWEDGNPQGEDRIGTFVTVRGESIFPAPNSTAVVGITTSLDSSSFVGNSRQGKPTNETDNFGRPLLVPKNAPAILELMNRNKVKMIRPLERVFEIISDDKLIETLSKLQFTSDDPTFDSKVFIQALHNIIFPSHLCYVKIEKCGHQFSL